MLSIRLTGNPLGEPRAEADRLCGNPTAESRFYRLYQLRGVFECFGLEGEYGMGGIRVFGHSHQPKSTGFLFSRGRAIPL